MKRGNASGIRQATVPILLVASLVLMFTPSEVTGHARSLVVTVSVPIEDVLTGLLHQAGTIPRAIRSSEDIVQKNVELNQQIQEQRGAIQKLEYELDRERRLNKDLVGFRAIVPQDGFETLMGEVIARPVPVLSSGPGRGTITILLGSNQNVKVDDLAVVGWVVVGKVVSVGVQASEVQLLTHPDCRVVAMVQPVGSVGVLEGYDRNLCSLKHISARDKVEPGNWVVTSGFQGRYPKGLFMGKVIDVAPGDGEHLDITVEPGVDFDKIDQVVVVRRKTTR